MAELSSLADWARKYIEVSGLALVPIEPGQKAPKGNAWNKPGGFFRDAELAAAFWRELPTHNLGVVLGESRLCSLDVDDAQWTRHILRELLGLELEGMADKFPCVIGNPARMRILFFAPENSTLKRHALTWSSAIDPDGAKFKSTITLLKEAKSAGDIASEQVLKTLADKYRPFTVFELRAGPVQDVLPPSIHPRTGKPYIWKTPPVAAGFPLLLPELLSAWQNWDLFKRDAEALCPWAIKAKPSPKTRASRVEGASPSVIEQFNHAHNVESLLSSHGYTQHGQRWLCPQSSTGLPAVSVTDGKVYSHHGADPLANGHQNDAFAVYCLLEHGGDVSKAVKAAARLLGLNEKPATKTRTPGKPLKPVPETRH